MGLNKLSLLVKSQESAGRRCSVLLVHDNNVALKPSKLVHREILRR